MNHEPGTPDGIGSRGRRVGGLPRVTGEFVFGTDLRVDGMLEGAVVRSPHAHARIVSIDATRAGRMPGVRAVLTAAELPAKRTYGLEFDDQPVLAADRVRYEGEPLVAIAADTRAQARAAAAAVAIEYDPLPAVTDMEAALDPAAPALHAWGNVVRHVRIEHGDPGTDAEVWVEGYYETAMQDQAALGPEAALAVPAPDGAMDLYVMTQWLHVDLHQVAPCLGLPEERVRLHLTGVGGAFGSREDVNLEILAGLLARATGRPVKLANTRAESFRGHVHRHPSRYWVRHGATRDGRLVVVRVRALLDGGAYTSSTPAVLANAAIFATGPYEVPNALIEATAVYTNNPPCGAMRGFGSPQPCFAYESQMDKLARALQMDPVELRLRNAVHTGSVFPTGQVITGEAPVAELLERCRALPMPDPAVPHTGSLPGGVGNVTHGEGIRRGVGYALGFKNIGYSEGFDDSCEARVTLSAGADGPLVEVHSAAVDSGQGLATVLVQVARTELGVPAVVLHEADTGVGSAGSSSASRQTVMSSGAVQLACAAVREELFDRVRSARKVPNAHLSLREGRVWADGVAIARVEEFLDQPIMATRVFHHRPTQPLDEHGQGDAHPFFAFVAERAVVDVDVDLGLARVVQLAAVQDVGRAINPQGLEGQIEGGLAIGMGHAVMEEVQLKEGAIQNASFTDYLIPTVLDVPPIVSELVEHAEPGVPYGAKGVGEVPTIAATVAVVNALRDATGLELNRVPVRPAELAGLTPAAVTAGPPPSPSVPGPRPVLAYLGRGGGQGDLMQAPAATRS
jgi:xanthine dehydrogenase D subunit